MHAQIKFLIAFLLLCGTFPAVVCSQTDFNQKISPEIRAAFSRGEAADVFIVFTEKADLSAAKWMPTKSARASYVFSHLQQTAEKSQQRVRMLLHNAQTDANSLFIVNAIAVGQINAALCRQIAAYPEVKSICADPIVLVDLPQQENPSAGDRNAVEWGVERIHAPEVWAMGYTGQGVSVGGADTGIDWTHPALQSHYRGWNNGFPDHNYNWHDAIHSISPLNGDTTNLSANPCGLNLTVPCDDYFHGTHTIGSVVGDDGLGNQIGVAPGAQWVGCRNMERGSGKPSSYLECFQWFLAPTDLNNANPDPTKSPDVINNSWYCDYTEGCTDLSVNELLHDAVINLRAAGVVVVVSNGNFGSACATTNAPPAYFEESFSVGSFRSNDTISGFSSRGPVVVDSSFRVKPNVAAPGSNVRSATLNHEYSFASGTSMAGPHVVGLVALMLSAQPALAGHVEEIETMIEQSAIPTLGLENCYDNNGEDYPNNTYGYGRIDALAAVNLALNWSPASGTSTPNPQSVACYPNPASGAIVFDLQEAYGDQHLKIWAADGQLVRDLQFNIQLKRQLVPVELNGLESGLYLYQFSQKNGILSGKFIKN